MIRNQSAVLVAAITIAPARAEIDLMPWQFRHAQSAIERLEKERFDVRGRATRPL